MAPRLLIAGGGTGGHLFPGMAIAEEWRRRGGQVLFIGTEKGLEKKILPQHGYGVEFIPVTSLKGRGIKDSVKTLVGLPYALMASMKIVRKFKPDCVMGIGGYASGPAVLAGKMMGYLTAVTDQNSIPGMTNRILGKVVDRVFLTFEGAEKFFKVPKVRMFGNPVLKDRLPYGRTWRQENRTLLVMGGSQGAKFLNQLMVTAMPQIMREVNSMKLVHQTGAEDCEAVRAQYGKAGIEATVVPFIDQIQDVYASSALVVSRAGAGSVTELALWGLPSILIPYPLAADDHQKKNAEVLAKKGGAVVFEQKEATPGKLADTAVGLLRDPRRLRAMSMAALKLGRPDAARKVVDEILGMVKYRAGH